MSAAPRWWHRPGPYLVAVGVILSGLAWRTVSAPVNETDVWWVAAAGRAMVAQGGVLHENAFSFTAPHHPWVMHEWLFAVPYALGLEQLGPGFFQWAALASCLLTAGLLLAGTVGRARYAMAGGVLALVAVGSFSLRLLSARPPHVALALPVALALVAWRPWLTRWPVAAVVGLEWLWVQAHGSFPVGLGVLGAGLLLFPGEWRRRVTSLGLAAVVTVLNPHGLALHGLVLDYLRGGGVFDVIHAHVVEFAPLWRSVELLRPRELYLGMPVLVALMVAAWAFPAQRVRGVVALPLAWLAASHLRHLEVVAFLLVLLLVPVADEVVARLTRATPVASRLGPRVVVLIAAVLGVVGAIGNSGRPAGERIHVDSGGPALARLAQGLPDGARVYSPFEVSGLVVWYGLPRGARVYFDARNDCYPAQVASVALTARDDEASARDTATALVEAGTDTALLPTGHALGAALAARGWRQVATEGEGEARWGLWRAPIP